MIAELARLVALAPDGSAGRINGLVRRTCGHALTLPPLPAAVAVGEADSQAEKAAVEFAEQFSVDVSGVTGGQRSRLVSEVGDGAFEAVVLMYVADFVPRVLSGLEALELAEELPTIEVKWDRASDPATVVFNDFLPAVASQDSLDAVTSEVVRLRGAAQHQCRLCRSLREATALEAGGSEKLYGDIEFYEVSNLLTDAHKAALRYVDALIWSPADIAPKIATGVRDYFSVDEAVELTFDVMRNASNKIAVAMGADAPRVETGTERYRILPDGQTDFG